MTRFSYRAAALSAFVMLAACQAIPPAPPPPAPPPPPPAPPPPPPAPTLSWEEAPVTPGDWRHALSPGFSTARFGTAVTLRCNLATRQIALEIADRSVTTATIRTTFGTLNWQGQTLAAQGGAASLAILRPASDIGFDWMAFSRGRMAIETANAPRLVVPAVSEIGRVVEDCRN